MEMYKKYLEEKFPGTSILYSDKGFVTYNINGDECYIKDIYVEPDHRKNGTARLFLNTISETAREYNCKFVSGSVVPSSSGSTESTIAMLACGFKLFNSINDFIIFKKDL